MEKVRNRDKFFWVFLILSVAIGLFFPSYFYNLEGLTIFIIPTIIGILFLKVDIVDVVTHIQKPLLLLYIAVMKLIISPLLIYLIFSPFVDNNLLIALVLLSALPTGVSSAVFTDFMKARTSLSLTIVIVTNLLSIFTIPFVFFVLEQFTNNSISSVSFQYSNMFFYLLGLISIPFFIAKTLKKGVFPSIKKVLNFDIQEKLSKSYNLAIILLLGLMIIISISFKADDIISNFSIHSISMGYLFLAFIIYQIIGYFSVFWLHKGEKIAISNSFMVVNNILGIVIALGHFRGDVVTLIILSLIPWNIMIIAKHWYKKYLP